MQKFEFHGDDSQSTYRKIITNKTNTRILLRIDQQKGKQQIHSTISKQSPSKSKVRYIQFYISPHPTESIPWIWIKSLQQKWVTSWQNSLKLRAKNLENQWLEGWYVFGGDVLFSGNNILTIKKTDPMTSFFFQKNLCFTNVATMCLESSGNSSILWRDLRYPWLQIAPFQASARINGTNPGCLGYIGDHTTRLYWD